MKTDYFKVEIRYYDILQRHLNTVTHCAVNLMENTQYNIRADAEKIKEAALEQICSTTDINYAP